MEIKIEIGNWQYNAGIVGLVSILDNFQKIQLDLKKTAYILILKNLKILKRNILII